MAATDRDALIQEVIDSFTAMRAGGMQGLHRVRREGASMGHLQVLVRLQMEGPVRVSRLARCLDVSAASATGMVDRMVERGLVERVRDDSDRRVVLVRLAAAGRQVLDDISSRGRAGLARILEGLDESELIALKTGLDAFVRAARAIAQADAERGPVDRDDCRPMAHPRERHARGHGSEPERGPDEDHGPQGRGAPGRRGR